MVDIAFVILQYGGYLDTKSCLESIRRKIDTTSYAVVVVDNCSPDTAYIDIKREIDSYGDDRFHLIKNNKNMGFANGNNVGIFYAREELKAQFVAVINNDIELVSESFYSTVKRKYEEKKFAVLGPLVLSGDGRYTTNPMALKLFSLSEIDHEIKHTKRVLKLNEYRLLKFYNVYLNIRKCNCNKSNLTNQRIDQENIKLHGCFLVMSPAFFESLKGFNTSTFLYMEEDILLLELLSKGLHTLYTPEICVFHKEGATTANVSEYERVKFVFSNRLKSQKIYRELLEKVRDF